MNWNVYTPDQYANILGPRNIGRMYLGGIYDKWKNDANSPENFRSRRTIGLAGKLGSLVAIIKSSSYELPRINS